MRLSIVLLTAPCAAAFAPAPRINTPAFAPRIHTRTPTLAAVPVVPGFEGPAVRRAARYAAAALSAGYAYALKRGGRGVNPERCAAVPIKCPWPFLLVFNPFTALGRRSLRAGLRDWQTWAALAVLLLARRW